MITSMVNTKVGRIRPSSQLHRRYRRLHLRHILSFATSTTTNQQQQQQQQRGRSHAPGSQLMSADSCGDAATDSVVTVVSGASNEPSESCRVIPFFS
jgi:hypothetical protein